MRTLRYAVRQLAATPGFTAVAILIVAIGIGASTAMFSTVHAVVLKPLALPEPDRLVTVYETNLERNVPFFSVSVPNYVDFKARATSFAAMAAVTWRAMNLTGRGEPQLIQVRTVTANFLEHARRADGPGARLHRRRGPARTARRSRSFRTGSGAGTSAAGPTSSARRCSSMGTPTPSSASRRRPAAARRHRDRGADAGRRRPRRTA